MSNVETKANKSEAGASEAWGKYLEQWIYTSRISPISPVTHNHQSRLYSACHAFIRTINATF